jgi:CRP-like cAMP-binding protein
MSWLIDAVPPSERAEVESALAFCSVLSLAGGSSHRSDRFEGVSLIAIEDGCVVVSTSHQGSERRMVLSLAGSGDIVLAPTAHERLEALDDSHVTLIPATAQRRLLATTAAATLLEGVADELRNCRESLAQFGSRRHAEHVQRKLVQLARTHGKVGTEGLVLDLPLTHELLADMLGSTRETVTRALAQLAHEGRIRHERGRYRLTAQPEADARSGSAHASNSHRQRKGRR